MFTLSSRGSLAVDIGCEWSERKAAKKVPRRLAISGKLEEFLSFRFWRLQSR
jgi:hypothetical protein